MIPFDMQLESITIFLKSIPVQSTDETFRFHILLHSILFVSKSSESINDNTKNNVQEHDYNNGKERNIQKGSDPETLLIVLLVTHIFKDLPYSSTRFYSKFDCGDETMENCSAEILIIQNQLITEI